MSVVRLVASLTVLCEGAADRAFLAALRDRRSLPAFDLPFPPDRQPAGDPPLHGRDGFVNMLHVLSSAISDDPAPVTRGIVIVADAADDPAQTFRHVVRQCRLAGFQAPAAVGQWCAPTPPLPPVAIITEPDGDPGGLETLCLTALRPRHAQVATCLDSFLACVPPIVRTAEKRDKAALACFTAAVHPDDPTRTLARVFGGADALIDVTDTAFDGVADRLTALLSSMVSPPTAP